MLVLIAIGLLAGLITGVSPCVLPVLPVVFFAGGTSQSAPSGAGRLLRPAIIILGLVAGFSVFTLLGSALLTAIGLPADFLRWAGLVVLVLVGLGLLFPPLQRVLERPFQRLPKAFAQRVSGGRPGRFGGNAFVWVWGWARSTSPVPVRCWRRSASPASADTSRVGSPS